jgi:hypothetical protein
MNVYTSQTTESISLSSKINQEDLGLGWYIVYLRLLLHNSQLR